MQAYDQTIYGVAAHGQNSSSPSPTRRKANSGATAVREFEVTLLTTRCGTSVVRVIADNRDEVQRVIDVELSSGEHITSPEHRIDDVQTEISAIREIHQ